MKRVLLLMFVMACRKEEATPPEVGKTPEVGKAPEAPAKKSALPWPSDNEPSYATLQGSWLVRGFGAYDSIKAWRVEGHKVTVYDPKDKTEEADELVFESPCDVRLSKAGWGGTYARTADGTPYIGLGDGGFKIGDAFIGCGWQTYWVEKGTCRAFKSSFREYEELGGTCAIADGKLTWKNGEENDELPIRADGSSLGDQLEDNKPTKFATWDEAKAAADKALASP